MKHRDKNLTGRDLVESVGLPPCCQHNEKFLGRAAFYLDELRANSAASDIFLSVMIADIAWDCYGANFAAKQTAEAQVRPAN
jgi:hypothetical protein